MLLEYQVKVKREVEEELSVIMRAEDEEDAVAQIRDLIDNTGTTEVRAHRFTIVRRQYHPAQEIEITPVEYEEPEGGEYA